VVGAQEIVSYRQGLKKIQPGLFTFHVDRRDLGGVVSNRSPLACLKQAGFPGTVPGFSSDFSDLVAAPVADFPVSHSYFCYRPFCGFDQRDFGDRAEESFSRGIGKGGK
jgi:hypothetical protein